MSFSNFIIMIITINSVVVIRLFITKTITEKKFATTILIIANIVVLILYLLLRK